MTKITLSSDQQGALLEILNFITTTTDTEIALSGPAGTGKSFLTKYLLEEVKGGPLLTMMKLMNSNTDDKQPKVLLTATTNKAAGVLDVAVNGGNNIHNIYDVRTIHSLLGLTVKRDFTTGNNKVVKTKRSVIISNALIVIDEASMINTQLLEIIREQCMKSKIIYIGDNYQLAPVKENTSPVFTDPTIKQVHLTSIQRQAKDSPIIDIATKFRTALDTEKFPLIESYGSDVIALPDADFRAEMDKQFANEHDPENLRIITWTNARVHQYNNHIKELLSQSTSHYVGERLLVNEPIMNGDHVLLSNASIVEITSIVPEEFFDIKGSRVELNGHIDTFLADDYNQVTFLIKQLAKTKNWKSYFEAKDSFADLRPYYASTVNKAQGSTFETVFVDMADIGRNTKKSEIARLCYTAITRASKQVYFRGALPNRLY